MVRHWIDELADQLYEKLKMRSGKEVYVFNGGLSVSGLQHVGRLRGEIIITEVLRKLLSKRGLKIKQYLTLYTQDAWKGKETQIEVFGNFDKGIAFKGWPLILVPDPFSCHANWVEHYWADFGPYIQEFTDGEIEVVTTTQLYRDKLREFTKLTLSKGRDVIRVVNKYRGRKPYEESYIPFEPICEKCNRIDTTNTIRIVDDEHIEYVCENCGHRGITTIEKGKLMWRIEWTGVWWSLGVDFEPYGKDHAMPGGSRDSCVDLAVNVYGMKPPEGLPYEWVEWRTPDKRVMDMGSSDFLGFSPREWLEVAHPHVFRFLVLKTPPMKKIAVGLHEVPQYYDQYFKAERIYYGLEEAVNEEERIILSRSYELSYPRDGPPKTIPEQVPYLHLMILAQIIPREKWSSEAVIRLKNSKHIPENPTNYGLQRILETLPRAYNWVIKHGSSDMRIELNSLEKAQIYANMIPGDKREVFREVYRNLSSLPEWNEENVKNALIEITSKLTSSDVKKFYEYFYALILGKSSGPRAAPLLSLLGREKTLSYIELAVK